MIQFDKYIFLKLVFLNHHIEKDVYHLVTFTGFFEYYTLVVFFQPLWFIIVRWRPNTTAMSITVDFGKDLGTFPEHRHGGDSSARVLVPVFFAGVSLSYPFV